MNGNGKDKIPEQIEMLLTSGENVKNLYRFLANNPERDLFENCQIIINRPNASICKSFSAWNDEGRRITAGRKGIPYYDKSGAKHFVFDVSDTHGEGRYLVRILPLKHLLTGLDELNGVKASESGNDYARIYNGVSVYLKQNRLLSGEENYDKALTEGAAFSLYAKTGFPKTKDINLNGLNFSLKENILLLKDVSEITARLESDIEDAYYSKQSEVEIVNDTDEENISDEPQILTPEQGGKTSEQHSDKASEIVPTPEEHSAGEFSEEHSEEREILNPLYKQYTEIQGKNKNAVVFMRLGDFYEAYGESAEKAAKALDLTLTGKNVGLKDRVPLCGVPYYAAEKYIEKLAKSYTVITVDGIVERTFTKEEKREEPTERSENKGDKQSPKLIPLEEDEESPFDEDDYTDDIDTRFPIEDEYPADSEQEEEEYDEADISEQEETPEKSKNAKGIKDRKRKVKPQLSFFDEQEKSEKDSLIDRVLLYGSGVEGGKRRIYEKYNENPSITEFVSFLKKEYGVGGHGGWNGDDEWHGGKGIRMSVRGANGEYLTQVTLNWKQVAERIADLIDDGKYFTEEAVEQPQTFDISEQKNTETISENTDLNGLLDQSELGGKKQRFKQNIAAIKLADKLYKENREATTEERKTLAKYVGWGGIAEVFDEHNESWQKEFSELKETLSSEDYSAAKGSVLNAHYTSKEVIAGIYSALERFGVRGNNKILEPACGIGNFFGFMPQGIASGAKLYGVELDSVTGRIAKKLYPQADIQIKGFEDTSFSDNTFDIVVGNVPFGAYSVYDRDYARENFYIHDYFIAKGIDKLKPNGIMAVVTSKGTMDKLNSSARKYFAERAELLGAVRLPNNAFKQTAGTEVVADILFFRKREEKITVDEENTEWLNTGKNNDGYEINSYYISHPENILGTLKTERGLYGAEDITVVSDGKDLSEAIAEAIKTFPENFYINPERKVNTEETQAVEVDYNVKPMCLKAENGKVYMRVGDSMVEQKIPLTPKDAYDRIAAMINLRGELRHILEIQSDWCSDEILEREQRTLNKSYDNFVRKYGILNSQTNSKLFKDDGDSALIFAAENLSDDKKTATKADIFFKRTIRPYTVPTSTDDVFEALQISQNERGCVDIAYIEELTNKDYDTVLSELGNAVFRNPEKVKENDKYSGFETAEKYLSGKVVEKLKTAKEYGYEKNIKALEQVQPAPIKASEITVHIGTNWVDTEYYKSFLSELLHLPDYLTQSGLSVYYNPYDGSWKVNKSASVAGRAGLNADTVYGTNRASAFRLFEDCLNLRATSIYDTIKEDGREKQVLNKPKTLAAREKQNRIKEAFADWIFSDPERRADLERTYNRLFNQLRLPSYDGAYLKFPEMNPAIELRPHQKNAVHRIITSGNTLLHHVVGSGKTFTICAAVMKLRQYGLAKKPMIAVPNHILQQWAGDFRLLYPQANLLIASKDDLDKENRKKFVSKVALGDWDAVIIAQSQFAKIPVSYARQVGKIQEEIDKIETAIRRQEDDITNPFPSTVKNLERIKKSKQAQLKRLLDDSKKDDVLIFESLGVDYLFIDEAHYYKNKFLFTKMNNVAGISTTASQRAADLEMKAEYINELHGGDKGVVFATGTPISNSMTEMYTMQSYLQRNTLDELGLNYFDNWAASFGETVTALELSPSGKGYRAKTRFSKFTGLPELLTLYRSFADVQTSEQVKLNVPEAEKITVALKPNDEILHLTEQIAERADRINSGGVPPEVDNMLKITSDGKKLALDPRCMDGAATGGDKLRACADNIFKVWNDTKEIQGTQIVFCDLSTPKKLYPLYEQGKDFDVYNELKYLLCEKGIPESEIAYIHEANSDNQKQELFDNVNSGKIRVLIGSTGKCGAGTNVQKRLVALHHLDTPYRPSDMEQREGRIIRQGNMNEKVKIFTYVTERTFDSYSYQILETKQRFISQINSGDLTVREAEDIDEATLSYAEIKAITAANPKIKRKMEVDTEVARLRVLEGQYRKNLYSLQDKVNKEYPEEIQKQALYIKRLKEDIASIKERYNPESFKICVKGVTYTDKKAGGQAFTEMLDISRPDEVIAEYCGFKISLDPMDVLTSTERSITLAGAGRYSINVGVSESGNLQRLDNFLKEFPKREENAERKLESLNQAYTTAKEQIELPFEHKEELNELLKEQAELNAELDLNKKDEVVIDEDKEDESQTEGNYMSLPESKLTKKEKLRERIAAMEVDVLPDYSLTQGDMHAYGYHWDGMLPMKADVAKTLYDKGLNVHRLYDDNTDGVIEDETEITENGVYGIAKDNWNMFVKSKDGKEFLSERFESYLTDGLKKIKWLNGRTRDFKDGEVDDIIDDLKGYVENSVYDKSKAGDFDDWYDDFADRVIIPELERRNIKDGDTKNEQEEIDYKQEVIKSIDDEFTAFQNETLKKPKEEIFRTNYKIYAYTEFRETIDTEEGYLNNAHYRALYDERGHILESLYDEFISDDYASLESYDSTSDYIDSYCRRFHEEAMDEEEKKELEMECVYLGKDDNGIGYFKLDCVLNKSVLPVITKEKAEGYAVASDACYLSYDELQDNNVTFLRIGRDITEEELKDNALIHMQSVIESRKILPKYYPVYYYSRSYAEEHDELNAYRISNKENQICLSTLENAIRNNYANSRLKEGFEEKVIAQFGIDRVSFVLASVIASHDWDGRYSAENKAWAKSIVPSENDEVGRVLYTNEHPVLLNAVTDRIRKYNENKENNEMTENNDFRNKTAQGYKVVDMLKDKDDRYIAIIQRDKDFVVAAGYDTKEGRWAQGYYDFSTYSAASDFRKDNYGVEQEKTKWIGVNVSKGALIRKYDTHSFMRMPSTSKEYAGYTYNIFNNRIKEYSQTTDLESDTGELCYRILLKEDDKVLLRGRDGDEAELTANEFNELVGATSDKDYEPIKRVEVTVPHEAMRKMYENSTLFVLPNTFSKESCAYFIPNAFAREDEVNDDGRIILSLPEDFIIKAQNRDGEEVKLTAQEFFGAVNGTKAEDYNFERAETDSRNTTWTEVEVDKAAKIADRGNSVFMRMPKGEYDGYTYFLSNKFVNETEEKLTVSLPENFVLKIKNGRSGDEAQLSVSEYISEVKGKGADDYSVFRKPSDGVKSDFESLSNNLANSGAFKIPDKKMPPAPKRTSGNDKGGM